MRGQLRVNNSAAVMSFALAGGGIARVNDVLGLDFVRQGKLEPLLADCCIPGDYPIYAATWPSDIAPPRLRRNRLFENLL